MSKDKQAEGQEPEGFCKSWYGKCGVAKMLHKRFGLAKQTAVRCTQVGCGIGCLTAIAAVIVGLVLLVWKIRGWGG